MGNHYTLYVDESGTGEFTDHRKPESRYFVITAIVIDEKDDSKLSGYFEYLKRKHHLKQGVPFHSYDIFEDKTSDSYMPPRMAKLLVHSLIEFFQIVPFKYRVVAIDKEECRKYFGVNPKLAGFQYRQYEDGPFVNSVSYTICSADVFRWFASKVLDDENKGAIIADSRDYSDKAMIDAFLDCKAVGMYSKSPKKRAYARGCDKELAKIALQMKERVTSIKFETKIGECPGLELADLISYISYLKLEDRINDFRTKKLPNLWTTVSAKMESKKIKKIKKDKLAETLSRNRVHKISKFVNKTKDI